MAPNTTDEPTTAHRMPKRFSKARRSSPRKKSSSAMGAPTATTRTNSNTPPGLVAFSLSSRAGRPSSSTSVPVSHNIGADTSGTTTTWVRRPTSAANGSPRHDQRARKSTTQPRPFTAAAQIGTPTNPSHSGG